MRARWALAGAAVAAALALQSWRHRSLLSPRWPPGGLVREDALGHGGAEGSGEEDDGEDLPLPPPGLWVASHGLSGGSVATVVVGLVRAVSGRLSGLLRLRELQEASATIASTGDPSSHLSDVRALVQETLLFVAEALRLVGLLNLVLVPTSVLAYWLLSLPFGFPPEFRGVAQALHLALRPLDRRLFRVLLFAARAVGLPQSEVLGEEDDTHSPDQIFKSAKRVLLGLLVVDVGASLAAAVSLAALVVTLRVTGILATP